MADTKVSALTEITNVDKDDLLYIVDSPGGTPTSKSAKVSEVLKAVNGFTQLTSVAGEDVLFVIDDPSGTPLPKYTTVSDLIIDSLSSLFDIVTVEDADSDTDDVLDTGIASGIGLMIVGCSTDGVMAVYRVETSTLTAISANALFNTAKDNASTYNVYYETDQYKVQNKVGDNKNIKVTFIGV